MDDARLVGRHNILGQQDPAGDVLGHLACHIVTLDGVDGGVLVGVLLLDLFVVALDQAQNPVIRGVGLAGQAPGVAVGDIFLCHFKGAMGHDGLFHQVLNLFNGGAAAHLLTGHAHALGNALNLHRGHAYFLIYSLIGLGNGHGNLGNIKHDFCTVAFDNLHRTVLLLGIAHALLPYYTISCGFVKT